MSIIGYNTNTTTESDIPKPSEVSGDSKVGREISIARGKKRSWVWDHFVKQNDQNDQVS